MLVRVEDALAVALAPVLRDIRATRVPEPDIHDTDWLEDKQFISAVLESKDGTKRSVCMRKADKAPFQIAEIADQVQEWVIEELWSDGTTNWPQCPSHPKNHPMQAAVVGKTATWVCPTEWKPFTPVGNLAGDPWIPNAW
jgi:hypothetical protein